MRLGLCICMWYLIHKQSSDNLMFGHFVWPNIKIIKNLLIEC